MCNNAGVIGSCNPPHIEDLAVPPETECSFPYGMVLTTLGFPAGTFLLPDGGEVVVGFSFNYTRVVGEPRSEFLLPDLNPTDASIAAMQIFARRPETLLFESDWVVPGELRSSSQSASLVQSLALPPFEDLPALVPPPADSSMSVDVTFVAQDPTMWPNPILTRVYATAAGISLPTAGVHELVYNLTESSLSQDMLKGVVLSRVDYAAAATYMDPFWTVYAPAGTTDISLPASVSPFVSGDVVWITPFGSGFGVPFDYDLFPTDVLLGPLSRYSEDSYAVVVP